MRFGHRRVVGGLPGDCSGAMLTVEVQEWGKRQRFIFLEVTNQPGTSQVVKVKLKK